MCDLILVCISVERVQDEVTMEVTSMKVYKLQMYDQSFKAPVYGYHRQHSVTHLLPYVLTTMYVNFLLLLQFYF